MKKQLIFVLLVAAMPAVAQHFGAPSRATPIHLETINLGDVASHIEPGTLVVVELENAVMECATQLGSEQWADVVQHYYIPPGGNTLDGRVAMTPLWNQVLRQVKMRPVDRSIQGFVRELQREGYGVIGLSAKDPDMAYVMLDHLESVDIDLTRTAPHKGHVEVRMMESPAKMVHGVLFTGVYNDLGVALGGLLEELGLPKKVVMISHKHAHLAAAYEGLSFYGIPFVGVRLGLADWRAANFRPELAEVQLSFFGRPLTNEAAKELLPKSGWFW